MRKDPILACLLNLLLVGAGGYIYLGQIGKGLLILAIGIVLGVFTSGIATIALIIWTMFDAYSAAKKMNRSETTSYVDRT